VLGGAATPTVRYPCLPDRSPTALDAALGALRTEMERGRENCRASRPQHTQVCGVFAVGYDVQCTGLTAGVQSKIGSIAETMDKCWGPGTSGFFNYEDGSSYRQRQQDGSFLYRLNMKIDPQPAYVAQNLAGNGTTVTGYYTTTWEETQVTRFPSGWTLDSTRVAGRPCSNVDLPPWAMTLQTIQATGNYRRCI
jgi:hypothetical protein